MKKIKYSLLLLVAPFLFNSCDFMDLEPDTTLTADNFYRSPEDMLSALYATYSALSDGGIYGESIYLMGDVRSDVAFPNQNNYIANMYRHEIENFTISSTNKGTQNYWAHHYRAITRANIVILRGGEKFPDNQDVRRYIQEAKVMRALFYLNLARAFGPVPLVTDIPEKYADSRDHVRAPMKDVYKFMITDLREAIAATNGAAAPLLYDKATAPRGRVTMQAALALLGKAFLSIPDEITATACPNVDAWKNISTNDEITALFPPGCINKWQAAEFYLTQVTGCSLIPVYSDLFRPTNKHSAESIWEVEYLGGQTENLGSPFYTHFTPQNYTPRNTANSHNYTPAALANKGQGNCSPTGYFMDFTKSWDSMYPDYNYQVRYFNGAVYSDSRISDGALDRGVNPVQPINSNTDYPQSSTWPYDPYTGCSWRTTVLGFDDDKQFFCGKYQSPSPSRQADSDDNWYIIRYADVLLMLAEAKARNNGGTLTQAQMDATINLVRQRAGVIPYSATGNSSDEWVLNTAARTIKAIFDERMLELAFEGHRWFDLVRSGTAVDVMNDHFNSFYEAFTSNSASTTNNYYMKNRKITIDEYCTLFPIPTTELLVNPRLTPNEKAR
ncbi:membrane protein [Bacteroidia bacterium]|nr:membrane protein [Bacteroidia bacterium]